MVCHPTNTVNTLQSLFNGLKVYFFMELKCTYNAPISGPGPWLNASTIASPPILIIQQVGETYKANTGNMAYF